ncbi:MAG TPA: hypothetical protein ENJ28_01350 [Gammaproteobacteria bacterium]|nr:hypothetical protein [Gammaproteobacteria bacterium]
MKTDLIYVDKELTTAIAANLIGTEVQKTKGTTRGIKLGGAILGLMILEENDSNEESFTIVKNMKEYLPEDVIRAIYPTIPAERMFNNVHSAVKYLATKGNGNLMPGDTISIEGILTFPYMEDKEEFDPFMPEDIQPKTFQFHTDTCFAGILNGEGYQLPVYFPESSINQVHCGHDNPVEIVGIVRWSPSYTPKGGNALNLALRVAAVWFQ